MGINLKEAIVNAGGYAAVAKKLGLTKQVVWGWAHRRVPAEKVMELEAIIRIPRHELRPDLYPKNREDHEKTLDKTKREDAD